MSEQSQTKTLQILVERWNAKAGKGRELKLDQAVVNFLNQECIVIPNPVYGKIQYDLPDKYEYWAVTERIRQDEATIKQFLGGLEPYLYHQDLEAVSENRTNDLSPYWKNSFFSGSDARLMYSIMAKVRPSTLLEIGVGNSTRFARLAIQSHGIPCTCRSIDPSPRANISGVSDEHIKRSVTDVDLSYFESLEAGDILFFDGSHVSMPGTDVPHMVMNVFPLLKPGVIVHIHDIHLPMEYKPEFRRRQYNEQHMVAAMLLFTRQWQILAPVAYLHSQGILKEWGSSFWLERV